MALDARFLSSYYGFPSLAGAGGTLAIVEIGTAVALDSVHAYCVGLGQPTPEVTVTPATPNHGGGDWHDGLTGPTAAAQLAAGLLPDGEISLHLVDRTEEGIMAGVAGAIGSGATVVCVNLYDSETEFPVQFAAMERIWQAAALAGVTVCCPAASPNGSPAFSAPYPASSEHVLAVGGSGVLLRADSTVVGEYATGGYSWFSESVAAPAWQSAATASYRSGEQANGGRALPDVVACDACDLLIDGVMQRFQSPAVANIVWGALLTCACEQLGHPLGFITDLIWSTGGLGGSLRPVAFSHDRTHQKLGQVDPWCPWTGWGSPIGRKLVPALGAAPAARQGMTAERCLARGLGLVDAWLSSHSPTDLDATIEVLRTARLLRPAQPDEFAVTLNVALMTLKARLSLGARPADLDEIIDVLETTLELSDTPDHHSDLGYHRMIRYLNRGSIDDLDAAVVEFKRAFTQTPIEDTTRYSRLLNVAWASEARYDRKRARGEDYVQYVTDGVKTPLGPRDLVLPINLLQIALTPQPGIAPPPVEVMPRLKRNLANLLIRFAGQVRHRPTGERAGEVKRAVQLLDDALDESAPGSEDAITCANSLWAALIAAEHFGFVDRGVYDDPSRHAKLAEMLTSTADVPVHPVVRAEANINLAALLSASSERGDTHERRAISIYRALVVTTTPTAPAASLDAAVAWSEWALAREAWEEVAEAHDAAQLHIQKLIVGQEQWSSRYLWTHTAGVLAAAGAYALAKLGRFDEAADALDRGRAIMLSSRLDLLGARSRGPRPECSAVYLLVTVAGGLALVAEAGGSWTATWLPAFDENALSARWTAYADAYAGFSREEDPNAGFTWLTEVDRALQFLGDGLGDVFGTLPSENPIVVVPVGALGQLPIFAAAARSAPEAGRISILPSLRLLRDSPRVAEIRDALVVRDETLEDSRWETTAVLSAFSPSARLLPQPADVEELLESWPEAGLLHIATHASIDLGRPLQSGLRLPGGDRLTIERILMSATRPVALAVLSACETGVADPYVTDEGVGIGAALLTGAAEGVIATLWPVDDLGSSLLMLRFYWHWRCRGDHPSLALSRAQAWLSDGSKAEKIEFVATGTVKDGVLDKNSADAMAVALRENIEAAAGFSHPYYWAGFYYSG